MNYSENVPRSDKYGLSVDMDEQDDLVGANRMELLLFSLGCSEKFGINVFKVREVCAIKKITRTPNMPSGVEGIVSLRGTVIPVLNLANFMGIAQVERPQTMMVVEYSSHTLGFLVKGVERIIRVDWSRVRAADTMLNQINALVTAVTDLPDGSLISILDVEKILSNAFGESIVGEIEPVQSDQDMCVFFVDDSALARKKIAEVLEKMGSKSIQAIDGREAWEKLKAMADAQAPGARLHDRIQVIMTDAEMPVMDGYVLTKHIKSDRRFDGIPVVMHSSLSSDANRTEGLRVGVDHYVAKFDAMALSSTLRPLLA